MELDQNAKNIEPAVGDSISWWSPIASLENVGGGEKFHPLGIQYVNHIKLDLFRALRSLVAVTVER